MKKNKEDESLTGCIVFWILSILLYFVHFGNGKITFSLAGNGNLIDLFSEPSLSLFSFLIGTGFIIDFIYHKVMNK